MKTDGEGVSVSVIAALTKRTSFCDDLPVSNSEFVLEFFCQLDDSAGDLFHITPQFSSHSDEAHLNIYVL